MVKENAQNNEARQAAPRGKLQRYIPSLWVWIPVLLLWCLIPIVRGIETIDSGMANLQVAALGFLSVVIIFGWFFFFSAYTIRFRLVVFLVCIFAVGGMFVTFEISGTSGSLVPEFKLRGSLRPDETLDRPVLRAKKELVDLSTTTMDDYPQFLGSERRATVEGVGIDPNWDANPPQLIWKQPIGAGWSSFATVNGFAVTMEQRGPLELVTCYRITTGDLLWSHAIEARHETIPGGIGPRGTPTIDSGRVYALGATGVLRCLDGETGAQLWQNDLLKTIGTTVEQDLLNVAWGRAASPLVFDDLVVVPLGGKETGEKYSLIALHKVSGEEVWRGGDSQISYSSPTICTLWDTQQILIVNENSVSSHDPETGRELWQYPWPGKSNANASTSQAVPIGEDKVFLSKGYSHGAELLRLNRDADGVWTVESLWYKRVMKTKMTNVVVRDRFIYGLDEAILSCVELDTGRRMWKEGRYGHGQIMAVDNNLLVSTETGDVVFIEASPSRDREVLGRFHAISGKTWNNPSVHGRFLLVRNAQEAACYEFQLLGGTQ